MRNKAGRAPVSLLWLRNDLRLADNPALLEAASGGRPVIPVFLWSPDEERPWAPGAASRWWIHHSLKSLDAGLRARGSRLIVRRGPDLEALRHLARTCGARTVVWSRRYEPAALRRDAEVRRALSEDGIEVRESGGALLFEPWEVLTRGGGPFQVFSPFWRACLLRPAPARPCGMPRRLPAPERWPDSLPIETLRLAPELERRQGLHEAWQPGEDGARRALRRFVEQGLAAYPARRDLPGTAGTSRLSPHLHFGEISPRQVWHAVLDSSGEVSGPGAGSGTFLRELIWREFAHHVLHHFPRTPERPLRPEFAAFPWRHSRRQLQVWQEGRTGYPLVDAGMRELRESGWLHNRVRMVVASFLVKHLLLPWRQGALWFWERLVDADLANNTLGWQWSAGCGADAAPYFRIFNPVVQGRRFDAEGDYLRRWLPELRRLPDRWIHRPWMAPGSVLASARIELGSTYPAPIIEPAIARRRALEAFSIMRRSRSS